TKLLPAAPGGPFYNVDCGRERGTTGLRGETVLLFAREAFGSPVDREREFMALTPGVELFIGWCHASQRTSNRAGTRTNFVLAGSSRRSHPPPSSTNLHQPPPTSTHLHPPPPPSPTPTHPPPSSFPPS